MQLRELGRTGVKVSSICLGTMTFGDQTPQDDAFAQMDLALARGVNFFDTAEMYSSPPTAETQGNTERVIGAWFKARGGRDKVVLASKVAGRTRDMKWIRPEEKLEDGQVRVSRAQIDYAVEQSLKRLQTDYLDLYQVHWPDRLYRGFGFQTYKDYPQDFIAFGDILEALGRHVDKGNIRAIGVSNESPWGVMRYLAESDARGSAAHGVNPECVPFAQSPFRNRRARGSGAARTGRIASVFATRSRRADRQISGRCAARGVAR